MNRQWICIMALAAMAAGGAAAQDEIEVGPREEAPVINPGQRPVPVTAPTDGRQVAVVEIQLGIERGKVTSARVVETKRVPSIAPKVFQRQGGDWEVRINGDEQQAFYVFSPAYLEAETGPGERNPYTYVAQDGLVDWTLIVPLYRGSSRIEARSIVIIDRASGEVILESGI